MKRFLLICLIGATIPAVAQQDTSNNYVKGFVTIPSFKINIVPDSSVYTSNQLKKNNPAMIMLFSPDCDHCQQQTKELLAHKNDLKHIQIIMVSLLPNAANKKFYDEYGLAAMPNVILGADVGYKLLRLYRATTFPAMYVYDKNGNLAKAFLGNVSVPTIIDAVK